MRSATLAIAVTVLVGVASAKDAQSTNGAGGKVASVSTEGAFSSPVMDKVDKIDKGVMDIEAMYWAWRVTYVQDVTYAQLEQYSKKWVMKPATKAIFLEKLNEILDAHKARPLTAEENVKYRESRKQIRAILAPGSSDVALINSLSMDYCIELDARHWARRIQKGEKEILTLRNNWNLRDDTKAKLFSKMDERLKMENPPLTEEEGYKLDACIEKMK